MVVMLILLIVLAGYHWEAGPTRSNFLPAKSLEHWSRLEQVQMHLFLL